LRSENLYRMIAKCFPEMPTRRMILDNQESPPTIGTVPRVTPHLVVEGEHIYSADAMADFHANLKIKYHRVASRPWLSLGPEPPAPEYR
jgi:hypothetical protein